MNLLSFANFLFRRDGKISRTLCRPSLRKQTSSGLGLKRVLKEGAPRLGLFASALLGCANGLPGVCLGLHPQLGPFLLEQS